jgi:2-oxoglutarate dehydrogenase E1 component
MSSQPPIPGPLSLGFIEGLLADYHRDPQSVPADWRSWFARDGDGDGVGGRVDAAAAAGQYAGDARDISGERGAATGHVAASDGNGHPPGHVPAFARRGRRARSSRRPRDRAVAHTLGCGPTGAVRNRSTASPEFDAAVLQDRVDQLVRAYRVRGHMVALIDPLGLPRPDCAELYPEHYGLSEEDMDRTISARTISGAEGSTLRELYLRLRMTYCRSIGVQFMHIDDIGVRHWLQERMEGTENRINLSTSQQIRILTLLTHATVFEDFLQTKYVGAKSFSLGGCESLIPLLDMAIERAGGQGVREVVIGMAHRGRLNVLANIMGQRPQDIFRKFEDVDAELHLGGGDVKYHLGHSTDWQTAAGDKIHLSLCFNPSHLECINPVVLGRVRSKQDRAGDLARERGLALLIHGDGAFAGEGVVQETLNLSELSGYGVGGAVHVIVNNQIGFTTSPNDSRSTLYASAVAKMLQIPIFHVNGEDPEAVAQVIHLAMDFRRQFRRDVVIDMFGYRRLGHNEGDEPSFTQPLMYEAIKRRKSVRLGYLEHLQRLGGVSDEQADAIEALCKQRFERGLKIARSDRYMPGDTALQGIWSGYLGGHEAEVEECATGVDQEQLAGLLEAQTRLPDGFHPHPKLERFMTARREMAAGERPLDWSAAESLAMASLAAEGIRVRLSGQDSQRGTFSHRHGVLHDIETGETYCPLEHVAEGQAAVELINSPLSEMGVMGFEYGYSLDCPDGLVMWEAQFGDFYNVAQVIVDQFIASAEDKWRRLSGIVLLLPHGFEGQGPEHSSARLERFLMQSAEDNMQIVVPTTPAQMFHVLRRQVVRRWRKPLVVLTPKSLLRHPKVVSDMAELSDGCFHRIIRDDLESPRRVKRVLLCSGKIFYDLHERREKLSRDDVAILRVEQLYPLHEESMTGALAAYADGTQVFWVQEEPENMGAWRFWRARFGTSLLGRLPLAGIFRPESASPATGSPGSHRIEQERILQQAFGAS